MFGLGTIINTAAIIVGGLLGILLGKLINDRLRDALITASGISVLFIGIAGAMKGMLSLTADGFSTVNSMLLVLSMMLGGLVGELINFEGLLERFGEWLKRKTGNGGDTSFVGAFLTASFTVCIGAMAVVGSIEDGIRGDWSILATKAVLDFVMIMVMTGALGKGAVFSAIPVFVFQGSITILAHFIGTLLTDKALANLSLVGSVLIFCVGLNLVWGKKVKVANLLPAIIFAAAAAYLPFEL